MSHEAVFVTLVIVSVAATLPASGQGWGRDDKPRDGACFYEDANFRGGRFCLRAGERKDHLPLGLNDAISSIEVEGDARVVVYRDSNRKGPSRRFDGDVRNLANEGLNDSISSVEVESSRGGRGSDRRSSGYSSSEADRIVRRAYEDILQRQPDAAGLRLYRSHLVDDGWTEKQVREALRNSPEYREKNTMTRQKAEEIVRRAYLAVLRREPDSGSYGYVQRVLKDKWTQEDVERELRKSPEYRNR